MLESQAAKVAIIQEQFALANRQSVDLTRASFENAVLLLCLIRAGANDDFSAIAPLATYQQPFAPTKALAIEFLGQLYQEGWISVHPETPVDSLEFADESITFELDRVLWALPFESPDSTAATINTSLEALFHDKTHWLPHWSEQQAEFSRKVALYECLQYLEFSLSEQGYPFGVLNKAVHVFDILLDVYSISQIFNFTWRATRDTIAFYQRETSARKQHAAGIIVDAIQTQGENARARHGDVKPYHRNPRCPQSTVSEVYFNTVLKIGDDGFYKPLFNDAASL